MFCEKCGEQIEDEDNFCGFCGANVDKQPENRHNHIPKKKMFCTKCGTEMLEGNKVWFCSQCGQMMTVNQIVANNAVRQNSSMRTVIKRSNTKKSTLIIGWFSVIFGVIAFSVFVIFYNEPHAVLELMGFKGYVSAEYLTFVLFGSLFILLISLIEVFKLIAAAKSFVCVCEDCVYGVAGKAFFFATQPFEVRYDQITNIGKGNWTLGNIRIDCGPNTYGCIINEPKEVINLIKEKIDQPTI